MRAIEELKGKDVFKEKTRKTIAISCVKDMVPNIEPKHLRLLEDAMEIGAFSMIESARMKDIRQVIDSIAHKLGDDYGMDEHLAADVLDAIALSYKKSDGKTDYHKLSESVPSKEQETTITMPARPAKHDIKQDEETKKIVRFPSVISALISYDYTKTIASRFCLIYQLLLILLIVLDVLTYKYLFSEASIPWTIIVILAVILSVGGIALNSLLLLKANSGNYIDDDGFAVYGCFMWVASMVALVVQLFIVTNYSLWMFYVLAATLVMTIVGGWRYYHEAFIWDDYTWLEYAMLALFFAIMFYLCAVNEEAVEYVEAEKSFLGISFDISAGWENFNRLSDAIGKGMLQFFALIIGGGFWMADYYSEMTIAAPLLNLGFYVSVSVFFVSVGISDS